MASRIKIFILIFNLLFSQLLLAEGLTTEEFLYTLKKQDKLSAGDSPTISLFRTQSTCENKSYTTEQITLQTLCAVAQESKTCQEIEDKSQLINCKNYEEEKSYDSIDLVLGCIKGVFDGVVEILNLIWSLMQTTFKAVSDPKAAYDQVSMYASSMKLYLVNEYDKAYDEASSPFKNIKAAKAVSGKVLSKLAESFMTMANEQYQSLGCMNFEARTQKICKLVTAYFIPPAAAAIKLFKSFKRADHLISDIKAPPARRTGTNNSDDFNDSPPGSAPPSSRAVIENGPEFLKFRQAYSRQNIDDNTRYITYLNDDGNRVLGKVEGVIPNSGTMFVKTESGQTITLSAARLEEISVSENARRFFNSKTGRTDRDVEEIKLSLTNGNQNQDHFRRVFNAQQMRQRDRYISIEVPGGRVPVKILSYDRYHVGIVDEFGNRRNLSRREIESARTSELSRTTFMPPKKTLGPTDDPNVYRFRQAYNNEVFKGDNIYVSHMMGRDRIPVKVLKRDGNRVLVENLDGYKYHLPPGSLGHVRFSNTSKNMFEAKALEVAGVQRTTPPSFTLSRSGDANYDNFRNNFNQGAFVGDQQYVSIPLGRDRIPARVTAVHNDRVAVEFVDEDLILRKAEVHGGDLFNIRSSATSKQQFDETLAEMRTLNGVDLNGKVVGRFDEGGRYAVDINLNSPGLKRWIGESQRLIQEQLGITPSMRPLNPHQRIQLQNFWIHNIRKKLESREDYDDYGNERDRIGHGSAGRADLGQVIEEGKAVCLELSMFASTLFSQYGIRSKLVIGRTRTNLPKDENNKHARHAWLRIVDENDNTLEYMDSNNSQRIHPDFEDYHRFHEGVEVQYETELISF